MGDKSLALPLGTYYAHRLRISPGYRARWPVLLGVGTVQAHSGDGRQSGRTGVRTFSEICSTVRDGVASFTGESSRSAILSHAPLAPLRGTSAASCQPTSRDRGDVFRELFLSLLSKPETAEDYR